MKMFNELQDFFSKLRNYKAYKQAKFAVKNISNDMINYEKKEIKYA